MPAIILCSFFHLQKSCSLAFPPYFLKAAYVYLSHAQFFTYLYSFSSKASNTPGFNIPASHPYPKPGVSLHFLPILVLLGYRVVLRLLGPGQMGTRTNGIWTNESRTNGPWDKWALRQMGPEQMFPGQIGLMTSRRRTIGLNKLANKFGQKI